MQTTIGGDEDLGEKTVAEIAEIASYTFSDGSKMVIVEDERDKNVKGIMKKYKSPRVKYYDEKGIDQKSSYGDFYKKALKLDEVIGKEKLFKIICKAYLVDDVTEVGASVINKIVDSSDTNIGIEREYLRKLIFGIHYGFYAEERYLMYSSVKYRFGKSFNLVKYYILLIEQMPVSYVIGIWNKDGTTIEEKHEKIEKCMLDIRKICPTHRDFSDAWEE